MSSRGEQPLTRAQLVAQLRQLGVKEGDALMLHASLRAIGRRLNGRVLRMGADLCTVTVLHFAEYLAEMPNKRRRTLYFLMPGAEGPQVRAVSSLDNEHGIFDYEGEDYFASLLEDYLAAGHGRRGRIGAARSELIEANDIVEFGARWMEQHLKPPVMGE